VKLVLLSSPCFSEEMNQMKLRRNSFSFLMTIRPSKEGINTNMLGQFMLYRIIGDLDGSCVVT
jgi:hypothetical protein